MFDSINNCHVAISCNFDIDYIMIEQVFNILLFIIFAIFFRGTETFYETEQNKIIRMENFQKKLFHHHCSVVVRKM